MSIRQYDQRGLDLFEALNAYKVRPPKRCLEIADNLVNEVEWRRLLVPNIFTAIRQALETWGIDEPEREPWELFLQKTFGRRGGEQSKLSRRPFAPLREYKDEH